MKKCISLLLVLSLCFGILQSIPTRVCAAEGDEIRAAKKIISVVYDDSGSMFGDRWVYANYAMQALTAQLNEQDELYITYMSRPSTSQEIPLKDLKAAVKGIRNWPHSANTPEESLDTAKKKLDSISESDVSTQFWLVIMTDGSINEMAVSMQQKLNSFKGAQMSNSSTLNVVYLAMGPGAVAASSDAGKGLHCFEAADHAAITTTMSDIANLISGRIAVDQIKQVDEKTISFNSSLPLYSISVLSQQSSASVVSAKSPEQELKIDRNIGLDAYEPFGNTKTTLYGNAAVINLSDSDGVSQVIQPSTYTITFSQAVDVKDLVVQYEPAIALKMHLSRGGVEVTDPSSLLIDDQVTVEIIPVVPGTSDRIDASSLPKGISWTLEYIVNDHIVDSASGAKLPGVTIREGNNVFRGIMQIPGFAPSVYELFFKMEQIVYNFGIQVDQPDPLNYHRRNSGDSSAEGSCLTFRITNDDVVLTKSEQKTIGVELEVVSIDCDNSAVTGFLNRFGTIPAECTLKQQDDGSYTLTPKPRAPFTAFLMMAGDYTVTVAIDRDNSITATGKFTVVPQLHDWIDLGFVILFVFLLLYLIFILFIKYKFTGQTVCYEVFKPRSDGGSIELVSEADSIVLNPFSLNLFLPKRACQIKFYGLTLQAGPDGTVIVTAKSIAKNVSHYGTSSARPTTSLRAILAALQSTEVTNNKHTERIASDQALSAELPVYFRSEGDRNVWRLRLQE